MFNTCTYVSKDKQELKNPHIAVGNYSCISFQI